MSSRQPVHIDGCIVRVAKCKQNFPGKGPEIATLVRAALKASMREHSDEKKVFG
jgi:hypothetical protein